MSNFFYNLGKQASSYVASGKKVQGVGLRKTLHAILDEQQLPGLAVNDPYTGNVELTLAEKEKEVLKELNRRIREKYGYGLRFKPMADMPLKEITLTEKDVDKLRELHYQRYLRSSIFDPNDSKKMSKKEFYEDLLPRFRLQLKNKNVTGLTTDRGARQLTGEEVPYQFMLEENLVR